MDLGVYAQDLHPWAAAGLATTLDGTDPVGLEKLGRRWLGGLADARARLYGTTCPAHGAAEVLHTFWVRVHACEACHERIHLYPYSLLTLNSRRKDEELAWYGCRLCGHVTRSHRTRARRCCGHCGRMLEAPDDSQLADGLVVCPQTDCRHSQRAFSRTARWVPVLVRRRCVGADDRVHVHFARPTEREQRSALTPMPIESVPAALRQPIIDGVETSRLRAAGLRHWHDLYPPRQLALLIAAADAITALPCTAVLRHRLRLILCGAAEMAGYASRWDRYYPKAFEATANHRFNLTGFSAETNLLAERGRGTLPRRLEHSVRAASWTRGFQARPAARTRATGRGRSTPAPGAVLVAQGSSTRQLPDDNAIDLVVTDPPYFDDVQYAELAALFLAWAQATRLVAANVRLDLAGEAVANSRRGAGVAHYQRLLTRIFTETARTLRTDGTMILTFHNTDGRAWWALGAALGAAGFGVTALAVAHAENESDHAKRNRRSFSRDLVLECRAGSDGVARVATPARSHEAAELLAAGQAVAHRAAMTQQQSYATFCTVLRDLLDREPALIGLHAAHTPAEKQPR